MATKEAKQIYNHLLSRLGPEVMTEFGHTVEKFDKQLDLCVGPHINRQAAADIIIKFFDIQWGNLKE